MYRGPSRGSARQEMEALEAKLAAAAAEAEQASIATEVCMAESCIGFFHLGPKIIVSLELLRPKTEELANVIPRVHKGRIFLNSIDFFKVLIVRAL